MTRSPALDVGGSVRKVVGTERFHGSVKPFCTCGDLENENRAISSKYGGSKTFSANFYTTIRDNPNKRPRHEHNERLSRAISLNTNSELQQMNCTQTSERK